ncbi:helicase-associated domain-containing protein [Leucobacter iarius]|uniref:Helicase XPB/Ssl2 N-terminal domain-containing protein n=1 Tax=Leucobacter iarius TaxID=333963 RepID=A0ABN2LQH7_9MICO
MSGSLPLAASIAGMERADLTALLERRWIANPAAVRDPLSLALELLRPDSVARALETLDRSGIRALLALTTASSTGPDPGQEDAGPSVLALGLAGLAAQPGNDVRPRPEPVPLDEVADQLRILIDSADAQERLERSVPVPSRTEPREPTSAAWFGAAQTTTQRAAAALRALALEPVKRNRRGGTSQTGVKTLAEALRTGHEQAERVVEMLRSAGLIHGVVSAAHGDRFAISPAGIAWLGLPHAERWLALAEALAGRISGPLATALRISEGALATAVDEVLPVEFPLLSETRLTDARALADAAEDLGFTVDGTLTPIASALLKRDPDLASDPEEPLASIRAALPPIAPGVYVQPDLSIIVPGPLSTDDEAALFGVADIEQLGVASSLRITPSSLARALESGVGIADARALLERLSLTGIPQPLDFLLSDVESKHGSVIVFAGTSRTRVRVADPAVGDAMLVDRALLHLQLQRDPGALAYVLLSRLRPEHVLAALVDARYAAIAGSDPDAAPAAPAEPGTVVPAPAPAAAPAAGDDGSEPGGEPAPTTGSLARGPYPAVADLVDRVLAGAEQPGSGEWTRRIELAIREKRAIEITAAAGSDVRTFRLLPASLSGGRLRASDQTAGVERTLPVSAITGVEILD